MKFVISDFKRIAASSFRVNDEMLSKSPGIKLEIVSYHLLMTLLLTRVIAT